MKICLSCGDNRATENDATCESCEQEMFIGGYRGDGL